MNGYVKELLFLFMVITVDWVKLLSTDDICVDNIWFGMPSVE